ncbi:MAG: hypothetical protein K8R69_09340 [Deltaproteobacteria bacterium]|nr:hypothetical protein [Deltaproteobacteria bacterium]
MGEDDPDFFAQGLLSLARRNLRAERMPLFSRELLLLAQTNAATRSLAEAELEVLNGGGSFSDQLERQAPHLLRELASPLMLGSFGASLLVSRAASLAVLARSTRLGWGTLLASEGAALAVEVPTLTLTRRLGTEIFLGADPSLSADGLRRELLSGYTTFGLLRVAGNALQIAGPRIRTLGGLNDAAGGLTPFGRFTFESLRFGSELSLVVAAHSLNVGLGLEEATPGAEPWLQGLLTVGHMRLAGRIMHQLGVDSLAPQIEAQRNSLLGNRMRDFLRLARVEPGQGAHQAASAEIAAAFREGRAGPFSLESWIRNGAAGKNFAVAEALESRGLRVLARRFREISPGESFDSDSSAGWILEPAFATAGRRGRFSDPRLEGVVFMSSENGDGANGTGRGGNGDGTPTRRAVLTELLQRSLDEYLQKADTRDTVLGKAAKRLQELLERIDERPDLEHSESFERSLAEIEAELNAAREHENVLKRSVASLKALFRRSAASSESGIPPQEAEQASAKIENDEAQRSALAGSLAKAREALQSAREYGWSEAVYAKLRGATDSLNGFYGRTVWKIPGLGRLLRRGVASEEMLQRRHGAILGLGVPPDAQFPDSPLTQRLRGGDPVPYVSHDLELELLHESLAYAFAQSRSPEELQAHVQQTAIGYRTGQETQAALLLGAETLSSLIEHGTRGPDLLERLKSRPEAQILQDRFLLMDALSDPQSDPQVGLEQLGYEANAADYFSTGLYLFLRSGGDGSRLVDLMRTARESRVPGYHPSLAASFFGAAYGRKNLPEVLMPSGAQAEAFILRATPPENKSPK